VAGIANIFPGETDLPWASVAIEQYYAPASILQRLGPDFQIAVLAHPASLASQPILVHGNHFLIGENIVDLRLHIAQIITRKKRGGKDRPQAEVRPVFVRGHAPFADLQHVRIIPVSRSRVTLQSILQVEDVEHAKPMLFFRLPLVADVTRGAPEVPAHRLAPEPGLGGTPLANAQHYRPARGIERVADQGISCLGVLRGGVAPVVLQIVNPPGGVLQRVLIFMPQAAGPLGASLTARVRIDSELQSEGMNVLGQSLDPCREEFDIGHDVAALISFHLPAIVDHNILIAGILHSRLNHGVGHLPDHIFAHVAPELVPAVPPHRGSTG